MNEISFLAFTDAESVTRLINCLGTDHGIRRIRFTVRVCSAVPLPQHKRLRICQRSLLKINKTKQNMCRLIDPEKRLDKDHEEYQGGHVPKTLSRCLLVCSIEF
jgi:hypothetical protein